MNILFVFLNDHGVLLNMLSCMNRNVIFVMGPDKESPLQFSRKCTYIANPFQESDSFAEYVNHYCASNSIDIIIPTDMSSFFKLSEIKSQLKRPLFITDSIKKLTLLNDKHLLYTFLKENNISTPHTDVIKTEEDIHRFPFHFPVIIKPFNLSGLKGVKKLNSYEEMNKYIYSNLPYSSPPLLAQDFIAGTDIDVSILALNGKIVAYTIQKWEENGVLQFVENKNAYKLASEIVNKLSFSGIAHFDMREEKRTKKVYVLECNPRFWGSIAASHAAGVDFIGLGIAIALDKNHTFKLPEYKKDYYVLISVIHRVILQMKWRYISALTVKNAINVLSDPLPFLITQLSILFKHS